MKTLNTRSYLLISSVIFLALLLISHTSSSKTKLKARNTRTEIESNNIVIDGVNPLIKSSLTTEVLKNESITLKKHNVLNTHNLHSNLKSHIQKNTIKDHKISNLKTKNKEFLADNDADKDNNKENENYYNDKNEISISQDTISTGNEVQNKADINIEQNKSKNNEDNSYNNNKQDDNEFIGIEANSVSKAIYSESLWSSTISLFISGFGDKSFFVSTIASVNYNKFIAAFASFVALLFMGIISLILGIEISQFCPLYVINLVSSLLFVGMGVKMIIDGLNTAEDEHFIKINKENENEVKENKEITKFIDNKDKLRKKNYKNEAEGEYTSNNSFCSTIITSNNSETIIFEIAGTTDEEEVISKSNNKLQNEFEKNYKDNEIYFKQLNNEETNCILENLKKNSKCIIKAIL